MDMCYNCYRKRSIMEKINIRLYTNFNNLEETNDLLAIKDNDVIKYIDLENNKVIVDMENDIMIRENSDYHFTIDFNANNIIIKLKSLNKCFDKAIKTIWIKKSKNSYNVKYVLVDDDLINEYHIKF